MQSRVRIVAALAGSLLAGALTAVQSRVNGGLGHALGSGIVAAAVSFTTGVVIVGLTAGLSQRARRGVVLLATEVRSRRFPWWALSGGLCGAFFVLTQGVAASRLGLALFTVGIVTGQVVGGLVMDRVGVGPAGRVRPTPPRLAGAVLVIVAVLVSVSGGLTGGTSLVWLALPLIAGAGISWQSAVNGLARAAAQSALTATLLNFTVGTAALWLLSAGWIAQKGWPHTWPAEPIFYIGGAVGVVFIAMAATLVRIAGVLLLSMSNVAGQLLAALLIEWGLPLGGGVTAAMTAGTLIALAAVGLAALPWNRGGATTR